MMIENDKTAGAETDQLETDQVFIDTQAFVRERFNWQSKSCVRLRELVRSGHIQVLTTSVTRSEVRSKIGEGLENARTALRKHDVVLSQLDNAGASAALDASEAGNKLRTLFDTFMDDVKAVEVPLSKNVDQIFDDYFHARPPFSAKKKSEFPDAFVVASLQERAKATGRKIYVISGDPDLKACCAHAPELLIVEGLAEIISKATVTKTVHDNLLSFLKDSRYLEDRLTECLMKADVTVTGASRPSLRVHAVISSVSSVDELNLTHLNVISQEGNKFLCVVDFEAYLEVWLELQIETYEWDGEDDHEGFDEFSTSVAHAEHFYAEIDIQFDSKAPDSTTLDHVHCQQEVSIDASEIDELRRYIK